ncbi:MAG: hypothetical protein ABIQ16_10390 [Polyangiaceae bacterium]
MLLTLGLAACSSTSPDRPRLGDSGAASGGSSTNGGASPSTGGTSGEAVSGGGGRVSAASGSSGACGSSDAVQTGNAGRAGAMGDDGFPGCIASERDAVACTQAPLASDFSGTWDVNRLSLQGTVSVNGAAMPNSTSLDTRGELEFRDVVSGQASRANIQTTGPGGFSVRLYAGTYDVTLITSSSSALVGLPTGAKLRLASALLINEETPLDFDVKTVEVTGIVTANGAPLPDSPAAAYRAEVDFEDVVSGGLTAVQIGERAKHIGSVQMAGICTGCGGVRVALRVRVCAVARGTRRGRPTEPARPGRACVRDRARATAG